LPPNHANDSRALGSALATVEIFAPVFLLFVVAEFSPGYFVGFYLGAMVTFFSLRIYDHEMARLLCSSCFGA